jgi:hypothetical protein
MGAWAHGRMGAWQELLRQPHEGRICDGPNPCGRRLQPLDASGSQQLVDFFFKEVAAELRLKDKDRFEGIADGLDSYGDLLSPLAMIPGSAGS